MKIIRIAKLAPLLIMLMIVLHSRDQIKKKASLFQELKAKVHTKQTMIETLRGLKQQFLQEYKARDMPKFTLWASRRVKLRKDAWGTSLKYRGEAENFSLISAGPDRVFATSDDISQTVD